LLRLNQLVAQDFQRLFAYEICICAALAASVAGFFSANACDHRVLGTSLWIGSRSSRAIKAGQVAQF